MSHSEGILYSPLAGRNVYHYSTPLEFSGYQWGAIYIGLSISHFEAQVRDTYRVLFYLSLVCLIIAAILSWIIARRFTKPILELRRAALQIKEGNWTARANTDTSDEVGELARAFNEMTEKMIASQSKIMDAYSELELYQKNLEELVAKRTQEITITNERLEEELAERERAEKRLAESEQRYRVIFDTAGNANMIVEKDSSVSMINAAFEKLSGYAKDAIEGQKKWQDFFVAEDTRKISSRHTQQAGQPQNALEEYEASFIDRQGVHRPVYVALAEIPGADRMIFSLMDLTEIKKLEAQLLQSQKMEAIGQLAGGVAHDFNNILTAIIGFASLLKLNIKKETSLLAFVEPILTSAQKASQLTQGLLAFSRKQIIEPKHIDINDIITKLEPLLARLLGEDVRLSLSCSDETLTIFADAGQVEQILINLSTNARDAMPDGGFLSISTASVTVSTQTMTSDAKDERKPGRYAVISVSDTGEGIPKETIDHIFEPFYTTKEVGKGTGLGLSIVYGVVKQHNGHINVYSEPGSGTTFRIYFPMVKAMAEKEVADLPQPQGGSETILVAEDDDVTRELSRLVLEKYGYTVIEATDGQDAVDKFTRHCDRIDLVLMDVIMPKLNGKAACDAMRKIKPQIKTLYISGYTADIIHKKGIFESNINFISKPVTPDALARKIRDVLDAPSPD